MLEILATKAALFDEYVRRSELKEISPDAVDVSSIDEAKRITSVAEEEHESSKPNGGGSVSMVEAEVRRRQSGGRDGRARDAKAQ